MPVSFLYRSILLSVPTRSALGLCSTCPVPPRLRAQVHDLLLREDPIGGGTQAGVLKDCTCSLARAIGFHPSVLASFKPKRTSAGSRRVSESPLGRKVPRAPLTR